MARSYTERYACARTPDARAAQNILCPLFYVLLEYFKTVAFAWMYLEGFYLHNTLVLTVFNSPPRIRRYMLIGWGVCWACACTARVCRCAGLTRARVVRHVRVL
jgi:hypothetical protein